jgi:hypothetical protein
VTFIDLALSKHVLHMILDEAARVAGTKCELFSGGEVPCVMLPGYFYHLNAEGRVVKIRRETPEGARLFYKVREQ